MTTKVDNTEILYFQITDLWKRFCEEHTRLLDLTFEEYSSLLSSDVEELENILARKNEIISIIRRLEETRQSVIKDLNQKQGVSISNVSDLITFMCQYEAEKNQKHLANFNALLIDLIEKLKSQNKKNQLFLNKAISSLKNIKESALGKKSFATYSNSGIEKSNTVP